MYALAALGYALIYNASGVVNFAQGEFIMAGAMLASALVLMGFPLPLAFLIAVVVAILAGLAMEKFAIQPAKNSPIVSLLIITLGVGSVIRGFVGYFPRQRQSYSTGVFGGEADFHCRRNHFASDSMGGGHNSRCGFDNRLVLREDNAGQGRDSDSSQQVGSPTCRN